MNNDTLRTSTQPTAVTWPHSPFDEDNMHKHLRDNQRATQLTHNEEAATQPPHSPPPELPAVDSLANPGITSSLAML